jgi:hypothetical protein
VQQLVRSSLVSAIVRSPERSRIYTRSVSALVQVAPFSFLLLLHTSCSCTAPRTLNTCTFLPRCIDATPSPTSPVHMHCPSSMHRHSKSCRVSCFARQPRGCVVSWPSHLASRVAFFALCAAVRRLLVHLEDHLAVLTLPPVHQVDHRIALPRTLSSHCLASVAPPP